MIMLASLVTSIVLIVLGKGQISAMSVTFRKRSCYKSHPVLIPSLSKANTGIGRLSITETAMLHVDYAYRKETTNALHVQLATTEIGTTIANPVSTSQV